MQKGSPPTSILPFFLAARGISAPLPSARLARTRLSQMEGEGVPLQPRSFERESLALHFHPFAPPAEWNSNDRTDLGSHMVKTQSHCQPGTRTTARNTAAQRADSLSWTITWEPSAFLFKAKLLLGVLLFSNLVFYPNIETYSEAPFREFYIKSPWKRKIEVPTVTAQIGMKDGKGGGKGDTRMGADMNITCSF